MGAILAKFRKPKTTVEILENLEQNIKDIEEYTISTQARQKRYVGNLLVISIGVYIIGFLIFYFAFFPPTWPERVMYSIPLLVFPLIIFLLKRLVAWYFQRKLNKNSRELNKLRGEKKKIIERVMEKETYRVAIEILSRFADKSNGFKTVGVVTPRSKSNQLNPASSPQHQLLTPSYQVGGSLGKTPTSTSPLLSNLNQSTPQRSDFSPAPNQGVVALRNTNYQLQRKKTPFPVINQQQQSVLEKIVDYLIGDGPHNRFAMICKECYAHNGMALQEEFEYSAFRCAFCNTLNPSRKSRPIGPKLPSGTVAAAITTVTGGAITSPSQLIGEIIDSSSTSTSEKESDRDSDVGTDEAISKQPQQDNSENATTEQTESENVAANTQTTNETDKNLDDLEKSSTEKKND